VRRRFSSEQPSRATSLNSPARCLRASAPKKLEARPYFEPVTAELSDWMPAHEHFQSPSRTAAGKQWTTRFWRTACATASTTPSVWAVHTREDLERIRRAREEAIARNRQRRDPWRCRPEARAQAGAHDRRYEPRRNQPGPDGFVVAEVWETKEQHDTWFDANVKPNVPFEITQEVIDLHSVYTP
jgi:hypothetical protein